MISSTRFSFILSLTACRHAVEQNLSLNHRNDDYYDNSGDNSAT